MGGLYSSIPTEVGLLTALTELYLRGNSLSSPIPSEIGQLTRLTVLMLSSNQFSGLVPEEIGRLQALTYLRLDNDDGLVGGLENTPLCDLGKLVMFTADCATGCTCCADSNFLPDFQPNDC
jgi:hypothetical protein